MIRHDRQLPAPLLIAVGGFSGSGKSTLSRALVQRAGGEEIADLFRGDVVRKELFGVSPLTRLGPEGYTHEVTERVYREMRDRARRSVCAGRIAIVDEIFVPEVERDAIAALAWKMDVPFVGLWLKASPSRSMHRVKTRTNDASDITPDVLVEQLASDLGVIRWNVVDADADSDTIRVRAEAEIWKILDGGKDGQA